MKYTLMHKYIPVADLELDSSSGNFTKLYDIYAPEHIPVGVPVKKGLPDRAALNNWWHDRTLPSTRDGIEEILKELFLTSTRLLPEKCFGFSLADQYWIRPDPSAFSNLSYNLLYPQITWEKMNFFHNSFSEDLGKLCFEERPFYSNSTDSAHTNLPVSINFMSPDNTTDGWLKKRWTILNGKSCLLKYGSGFAQQEPYNEVLASAIMRRLNIPHIDYTVSMDCKGRPFSVCENFVTDTTELIPAHYLYIRQKQPNNISPYKHFINQCQDVGISPSQTTTFLDQMLTVDFLIVNEDRHTHNFGVIRNAETLEYMGFAPVYDTGTSLWFDTPTSAIHPSSRKLQSKPFKSTHSEQIKLVTSFDWLDLSALNGIDEELNEILKEAVLIDTNRRDMLCRGIRVRVKLLKDHIES